MLSSRLAGVDGVVVHALGDENDIGHAEISSEGYGGRSKASHEGAWVVEGSGISS